MRYRIAVLGLGWMAAASSTAFGQEIAVELLRISPQTIHLQANQPYPQPLIFRVVRQDTGQPVAGVNVEVGRACGNFEGCPGWGYFWEVFVTPTQVSAKDFISDCSGLVKTDRYNAGNAELSYSLWGQIRTDGQTPPVVLTNNDPALRSQALTVV